MDRNVVVQYIIVSLFVCASMIILISKSFVAQSDNDSRWFLKLKVLPGRCPISFHRFFTNSVRVFAADDIKSYS